MKKETIRVWFEFYKLAKQSGDIQIRKALPISDVHYASWGSVKSVKFDEWWKTHAYLFKEPTVRQVQRDSNIDFENNLILEIPLNESIRELSKKIQSILSVVHKRKPNTSKSRKIITGKYRVTTNSEPKLTILKDVLNVYRDVYLFNSHLSGMKLVLKTHEYYKNRPRNKVIPSALNHYDSKNTKEKQRVTRNLRRWIQWAKQIELNVAKGEFPGKY
jgi:hypothetical protein